LRTSQKRTAVLLDPHPIWLDAIEPVLASIGIHVIGRATSPERALALIEERRPDIAVVGTMTANGATGTLSLIRSACEKVSGIRVIVLGEASDAADVDAAFAAGAVAYVIKTAQADDLAATIRQTIAARPGDDEVESMVTRREREILKALAEGRSNRELARMFWITEETVKFHLSNIYRKLEVSNRTEAAGWAHRHGLVDERERLERAEAVASGVIRNPDLHGEFSPPANPPHPPS
jgi:DNA-binding NarL/FixJ family response regulator